MAEQLRADLLAAAAYLTGDGVSMTVAEAERIAAALRRLAADAGVLGTDGGQKP